MRKNHKLVRAIAGITPVIALAALSGTASATTYIYEPFDYTAPAPPQPLLGQTNTYVSPSRSWLLASDTTPLTALNTASGSLTGPAELKPSIGHSLAIAGVGTNSGGTERFSLFNDTTTSVSTGSLYYSFLLNVNALTGSNNTIGGYFFSLNNTGNSSQATDPTISPARMQMRIDPTDATKFSLGVFNNRAAVSGDAQWYNGLSLSTTYFVVAGTDVSSTAGTNARLWINPSSTTYGAGTAPVADRTDTTAGTAFTGGFKSVLVRQSPAPFLTLDEVRVANSWSEVTVTPAAYWDINAATAGAGSATPSGTWDGATANWSASSAGDAVGITWPGAGNKAVFSAGADATGAYTITVSGTQNAAALSFEDGAATLTGGTINLSSGILDASTGVTATIASAISGSSGLNKSSPGTVVLTGALSYTGATTISAGTLQIGNGTTAGTLPTSSAITTNGTLAFNRSNDVTQGTDFSGSAITGTGGVTQAGSANLILNVANTFSGTTKATSGTLTAAHSLALQNSIVDTSGAGSIVFDNALTSASVGGLSGSTNYSANSALSLTVGNSTATTGTVATFGGVISGSGSVTKVGANTQEVIGVNTYSGGTNVNAGILQFGATTSMPASGAVSVNSGGTLAVHVSGAGEWATSGTGVGTINGLIAGDGGQTASQVTWTDGSSLGINTQPVGTTLNTADVTYAGNIGSFNGVSDLTQSVGFTKSGYGTLSLTGSNNTFRGQLKVANEGGTLRVTTALPNAGQSMAIPTVSIGNALVTNPTILKLLVDNALPSNSLISFGSGVAGNVTAKTILRLHDADPVASYPSPAIPAASYNQTIRGITGGSGLVQVGAGTLTIDVPASESYSWSGTMRTDGDATWHSTGGVSGVRGVIIKTGLGRQDITQFNSEMSGEFRLQQGTLGVGDQQAFGGAINTGTPPFYDSTSAKLTITGGTMMNISSGSQTFSVKNIEIGGSFTFDPVGANNSQFLNKTITLTTANPTITVLPGTGGQFIFASYITDNGQGYGFTKAGTGILNLTSDSTQMNNFSGPVTVSAGQLRTVAPVRIGDGTGGLYLSGGQLAFNGGLNGLVPHTSERYEEISNPLHVTADSSIAYDSTTGNLTDVTDPLGIQYVFTSNTVDRTGGTLTFSYLNTASTTTVTYRPRFTGSGFDYTGPVVINKGTGARNTVLESTNASGTQTWSGNMTGTGSYLRGAGGTTVLGGQTISVNIANSSNITFDRATDSTYSGVMSGGGVVVKQGAGTLTLSGANTYSGVTTINAGTLQVGNAGTTGTLGTGNVTNDGGLTFNRSNAMTVANDISGTGTITKSGSGTTTLSGANTYTGNTNINAGTLSVGNSGNLGGSSNGIVFNGGTLAATGAITSGGRNVTVNAGNGTIDTASNSVTVGNIDGSGNFTKSGSGTLTANRYRVNNLNITGVAKAAAIADPTSSASVIPGVSVVNSLVVNGASTVNLTNSRIITNDAQGVEAGGTYDGVQGLVQSLKLFTDEPLAAANQTAIGVATAAESKSLVGAATTLWSGQTVDSNDTLVMYTWAGDANLDGKVNADDYASIDLYSTIPGEDTWNHGDFNYNGVINADDYALIDNNVQNQNYVPYWTTDALRSLDGGSATAGLTAVPEPASIGLLMVSAAGLMGRRRRTK
jgi:autotransporter-associated beta strand protein